MDIRIEVTGSAQNYLVQFKMQSVVTMKCHSARLQVKLSHKLCIELYVSRLLIFTFLFLEEGGGGGGGNYSPLV